jgi:integrase
MDRRDTRTRWDGIFARHQRGCPVEELPRDATVSQLTKACKCQPSHYGRVYDRVERRQRRTKSVRLPAEARRERRVLLDQLEQGGAPQQASLRIRDAHTRLIADAQAGRALNKHGRKYKRTAWEDIDECLRVHVVPTLGPRRVADVRQRDLQRIVDDLSPRLSGSRVRSVVNAIRSLYRWAKQHELAAHDPAAGIILPAVDATPRDRIAPPREFADLLGALPVKDALPYALGGYAWGRRSQIQRLLWQEVDLKLGLLEWGTEEDGARKSEASRHVVPLLRPVWALLREAWIEQGRPAGERRVCPPRNNSKTGLLSTGGLAERADRAWSAHKLQPIGLHECRHTAATWLDAAGISPKTASVLMGHSIPDRQPGAAAITLRTYTHLMPDALERARRRLDEWLLAELAREATAS